MSLAIVILTIPRKEANRVVHFGDGRSFPNGPDMLLPSIASESLRLCRYAMIAFHHGYYEFVQAVLLTEVTPDSLRI